MWILFVYIVNERWVELWGLSSFKFRLDCQLATHHLPWRGENTRIQTEILLTWNESDRCRRTELIWDYWKVKNNSGFKISVPMFCKVSGLIRERKETYCFSIYDWHSISFQKTSTEECLTGHDRLHLFDARGCVRKSETLFKPTVSGLSNQCHFFTGRKILQNWQHCGLWVF